MENKEFYVFLGAIVLIVVISAVTISFSQQTGEAIFSKKPLYSNTHMIMPTTLTLSLEPGICDGVIIENEWETSTILYAGGLSHVLSYNSSGYVGRVYKYGIHPLGSLELDSSGKYIRDRDGRKNPNGVSCDEVFTNKYETITIQYGINQISFPGFKG
ncbi:MAG TPA: hypothetical protein VJB89_04290 [Candidatus Nanoarchaeia archaeon]|nr:hypothetical protein [Candidatus Nanoarchaeia archaeon]